MKTSKFFSIAALILCGLVCVANVNANTGGTSAQSNPVTVNIKFKPIQSIVVNEAQKTVDLVYGTKEDYANGVSRKMDDHLEVFSTGGFVVSVASNGNFKNNVATDNAEDIDASDVQIIAEKGTGAKDATFTPVNLKESGQALIASDKGGNSLKYNITYNNQAGADHAYIDKYFHGNAETVYTAQVTYTIVTK